MDHGAKAAPGTEQEFEADFSGLVHAHAVGESRRAVAMTVFRGFFPRGMALDSKMAELAPTAAWVSDF